MADSGTFTHSLPKGLSIIHRWSFPFDRDTGKVSFKWEFYLKATQEVEFWKHSASAGNVRVDYDVLNSYSSGSAYRYPFSYLEEDYTGGLFDVDRYEYVVITPGEHYLGKIEESSKNYSTLKSMYQLYSSDIELKSSIGGDYIYLDGEKLDFDPEKTTTTIQLSEPDVASTITCATTYIGEQAVIIIDKYDTSFTTTITYQFGNLTGTVIEKTSATQVYWLLEGSKFLSQMNPAATAGTCKLTAYTYDSSGKQLGTPKEISFTVLMDSNAAGPLFNPTVSDTNSATIALTGNSNILVKYFSNAKVSAGAIGQAGATIKSVSIENAGVIVNSSTATFNKVESPIFNITATDSRVFVSKTEYRATMVEYSKLSCNLLVSTPTVSGDATITIEGNYYNGSFGATNNTLTVQYRMKTGNESYGAWQTVSATPYGSNYKVEIDLTGLDYQTLYSFQAMATDKLMTITTKEVQSIGKPVYDWGQNDFHVSVAFNADKAINMLPDQSITGTTPEGDVISALVPCDSIGNTVLGYGGYTNETGATKIYGNEVDIIAANGVSINGKTFGGKVLYQGASHVNANQTINLSEAISDQINGIVLVFSLYRNGAAEDVSINSFFVSKKEVELLEGAPHFYFMGVNAGFSILGAKYLYIYDTYIQGHEGNTSSGANSGISFNNSNYVLRYVLGV